MLSQDQFFLTAIVLLLPLGVQLVVIFSRHTALHDWVMANRAIISGLLGAFLAGVYHIDTVYFALNERAVGATLASYMVEGVTAGLAASGFTSVVKAVGRGSLATSLTSPGMVPVPPTNDKEDP